MQKILTLITDLLGKGLISAICKLCDAVTCVFQYLRAKDEKKQKDAEQKEIADAEKEIADACDNGSLDDLMDATEKMKKTKNKKFMTLAAVLLLAVSGCVTTVDVYPAKSWEGRYDNESKLLEAAKNVDLGAGESVWLLSNRTMKRLLTNTQEK